MLAAFLVLAPLLSGASASTVSVSASPGAASGSQVMSITGTVSPAPGAGVSAFIQITNPAGKAVAAASVPVDPTAGTFSYTFAAGGTTLWTTGSYTVTATAAGATGITSFTYTAPTQQPTPTGGNINALRVWVQATTPAFPGDTVQIATLVEWVANGSLATTNFQTAHYHTPAGGLVQLGTPTTIHKGFYFWTITLAANAAAGTYFVHVWVNNSGPEGQGLGSFTVQPKIAQQDTLNSVSSAIGTIQSSITTSLGQVTSAISQLQTAATATQAAATAAQKAATDLSTSVTSILSGVQNSQTYVLVVAALAAITLVLELAILVRKLS